MSQIVTCMNCCGEGRVARDNKRFLSNCIVCRGEGTGWERDLFRSAQVVAAFRQYTGGADPYQDIRWSAYRAGFLAGAASEEATR